MNTDVFCSQVCKNVLISGRGIKEDGHDYNKEDDSVGMLTPDTPSTHYPGPSQEKKGNLIHFYNQIYSTKMENFAKQFAPTSGGDTPPLSPYPRQWTASPRRQRLSSSRLIFISPLDTDTTSPSTPGLCYVFNSSPRECLRRINNMIRKGRSPNRRCYGGSDRGEEEEDGPSVKRLRLDGQSAFLRRLSNVVNDRVTRRDRDQDQPSISSYKA
ncbi:retinoblastoma-like protein 2 [Lycodopsis pacificus]